MMLAITGFFFNIFAAAAFYTGRSVEGIIALVGVAMIVAVSKIIEEIKKK